MLKKITALLLIGAMLLTLAACGGTTGTSLPTLKLPEKTASAASGAESSEAGEEAASDESFEDSLEGLCSFMEKNSAVVRNDPAKVSSGSEDPSFTEMAFEEIGAIGGCRYRFSFNGSSVQVEFYQYDLENLDDKAQTYLNSVKEKGSFPMLDREVPAVLSDSGKYLMVYTDSKTDEQNKAQKERVEELFRGFKAKG